MWSSFFFYDWIVPEQYGQTGTTLTLYTYTCLWSYVAVFASTFVSLLYSFAWSETCNIYSCMPPCCDVLWFLHCLRFFFCLLDLLLLSLILFCLLLPVALCPPDFNPIQCYSHSAVGQLSECVLSDGGAVRAGGDGPQLLRHRRAAPPADLPHRLPILRSALLLPVLFSFVLCWIVFERMILLYCLPFSAVVCDL